MIPPSLEVMIPPILEAINDQDHIINASSAASILNEIIGCMGVGRNAAMNREELIDRSSLEYNAAIVSGGSTGRSSA